MKSDFEAYIVTIRHRRGERVVERKYLNVPLDAALGRFERLSDLKLRELTNDLLAEADRRSTTPAYDYEATQIRKAPS